MCVLVQGLSVATLEEVCVLLLLLLVLEPCSGLDLFTPPRMLVQGLLVVWVLLLNILVLVLLQVLVLIWVELLIKRVQLVLLLDLMQLQNMELLVVLLIKCVGEPGGRMELLVV